MICSDCHKEVSEYDVQPCFIDWCEGALCQDCAFTHEKRCPDHRGTLILTAILGDGDGVKATATMNGKVYTVVQCLHDDDEKPYRSWIHWDSIDNVHHHDFNFESIAFFNPASEPVWSRA